MAARVAAVVSGCGGVLVRERARPAAGETGPLGGEVGRRPRWGDVAILFRRLTQVGPYESALREAGIPCRLARGGGFYQAPEVRDLGELLVSLTTGEAGALAALLRSPLCGVGEGSLLALARSGLQRLATWSPAEAARALVEAFPAAADSWPDPGIDSSDAGRLRCFLEVWGQLRSEVGRLSVADLLARAVERLDLEAAHLAAPDGERRLANLRKVLALAAQHDQAGGDAESFARRLRRLAAEAPREPEAELEPGDAVALLSVHQAKGLEWPVVFVPDLGAAAPADTRRAMRDPAGFLAAAFHDAAAGRDHPTTALVAAREEGRRAGAAESRRLLYVALTRARDRLVLSGEAGRGESWRTLVEETLQECPELALRVPYEEARVAAPSPRLAALAGHPGLRPSIGATPLPPWEPPAGPSPVRLAVTTLAEHARCPRRVYFARHLGLTERGPGGAPAEEDPERATVRGTLAHALLAEVDLGLPPLQRRAQLLACLGRRGEDPRERAVQSVLRDVVAFLDSAGGARLAAAARRGTLRREVPFLLRLGGGEATGCYLSGTVDALIEEGETVSLLDFKYALPRPGAAERYRLQLLAYALAAGRARPGRRVKATLQFLRGDCAAVDLTPTAAAFRRFAAEGPGLAVAAASGSDLRREPSELGRDEARCRAEGCGFAYRCFAARRPDLQLPAGLRPGRRAASREVCSSTPSR